MKGRKDKNDGEGELYRKSLARLERAKTTCPNLVACRPIWLGLPKVILLTQ